MPRKRKTHPDVRTDDGLRPPPLKRTSNEPRRRFPDSGCKGWLEPKDTPPPSDDDSYVSGLATGASTPDSDYDSGPSAAKDKKSRQSFQFAAGGAAGPRCYPPSRTPSPLSFALGDGIDPFGDENSGLPSLLDDDCGLPALFGDDAGDGLLDQAELAALLASDSGTDTAFVNHTTVIPNKADGSASATSTPAAAPARTPVTTASAFKYCADLHKTKAARPVDFNERKEFARIGLEQDALLHESADLLRESALQLAVLRHDHRRKEVQHQKLQTSFALAARQHARQREHWALQVEELAQQLALLRIAGHRLEPRALAETFAASRWQ